MASDNEVREISKIARKAIPTSRRWPVSVYRLNFSSTFTFHDAANIVPYLHELGITDCYASPYLKARSGSQHGYDVTDHGKLNPEIGNEAEYDEFVRQLHRHNMGQIIDFIPNHMGIFENSRWMDVLENGPCSVYARFFDIDWEPIKAELHHKVLLPILEDLYGNVLESGGITLKLDKGAFIVEYQGHRLPIGPKTTVVVLETCLKPVKDILGTEHPDYIELQSIITACKNLPERSETNPEKIAERHREKEIIKRRLGELCTRNDKIKKALSNEVKTTNGTVGDNSSFRRLHDLLEKQAYRLSYWRVAADEINYRRFFDVNDLVAIKMEDPLVFEETHRLVLELLHKGAVTGVRIDHIDGLYDPADYLWHLQRAYWVGLCLEPMLSDEQLKQLPQNKLEEKLLHFYEAQRAKDPGAQFVQPLYIVVEKILGDKENLRETWPIHGTTGYDFSAVLNRIFVNDKHKRSLIYTYQWFTGNSMNFEEVIYLSKSLVMKTSMSAEVNLLAHQLNRVSERSWQYRDFTLNSLRDAIREVIASFQVYRTYINAFEESVDEKDRYTINNAINRARRRNPAVSSAIFEFIRDALLLKYPVGMSEEGRNEQRVFVMRFQQLTGSVMAKGVEDTAFYIYNPLLSLNDVGSNPQKFGCSIEEFYRQNRQRCQSMPYSFISTSTHDSKRGEDVRARINILSEVPVKWRSALNRWSRLNRNKKIKLNEEPVPDRNEEYLIYQTILGTYSLQAEDKEHGRYLQRIQQYILKAIKEAKVHTSWINPDIAYEEGITSFVYQILETSPSNQFLADFMTFLEPVAISGIYNSLSQAVIKFFSPGVPDIYQGNELWAFNLTDPDNRRPVDFGQRIQLLAQIKKQAASTRDLSGFIRKLVKTKHDGLIKLYVTWMSLNYRREHAALFNIGNYLPLKVAGAKRDHVCAFAWKKGNSSLLVAVPILIAGLTHFAAIQPFGEEAWGDTRIVLPGKFKNVSYHNIFTGEALNASHRTGGSELYMADIFTTCPVAVLESVKA